MSRVVRRLAAIALTLVLAHPAMAQTTVRYVHTDALGSVVAMTDENRVVVERREYEPYGQQLTALEDGPGYTGHVQDAASGLTYMQQRYYDPAVGRFLSIDPVTTNAVNGTNFNRYWYGNNNPYKFTDPDGRYVESALDVAFIMADVADISSNGLNWTNGLSLAANVVGLAVPVGTGFGPAVRGISAGVDAVKGADQAVDAAKGADFVVTSGGTAVHASQSQMKASLESAGISGKPIDGGTAFELPNGVTARAMEPSGQAPRRTSFDNANGGPVTPEGAVPQPPRGSTTAERREYVRERTHVEQRE